MSADATRSDIDSATQESALYTAGEERAPLRLKECGFGSEEKVNKEQRARGDNWER
jgi:hypothetical protein